MSPWRITFGLALLTVGAVSLLDRLGYLNGSDTISRWWPIFLVLLGVAHWIANPRTPRGAIVVTFVGLVLLVDNLGVIPGGMSGIFWPVVFVCLGVWVLVGRGGSQRSSSDGVHRFVAFGGLDLVEQSKEFRGGSLNALFGGIKLDLREAELDSERASLEAVAAFGGVEILVPKTWRVNVTGLPLFGAVENKALADGELPPDAPTLNVRATALFGAVEVKH